MITEHAGVVLGNSTWQLFPLVLLLSTLPYAISARGSPHGHAKSYLPWKDHTRASELVVELHSSSKRSPISVLGIQTRAWCKFSVPHISKPCQQGPLTDPTLTKPAQVNQKMAESFINYFFIYILFFYFYINFFSY